MDMSTKTAISIEEYLRTSFEGLDREYVDGEIVERTLPTNWRSKTQCRLGRIFDTFGDTLPLYARTELRSRVSGTRVRIPDVSVYSGEEPADLVPVAPPLIAIEILSPDDRQSKLITKLEEYREWGVRHLWLVNPQTRKLHVYEKGVLREVDSFEVPEFELRVTATEIFR
jgi:Uma2 family endonuclease